MSKCATFIIVTESAFKLQIKCQDLMKTDDTYSVDKTHFRSDFQMFLRSFKEVVICELIDFTVKLDSRLVRFNLLSRT